MCRTWASELSNDLKPQLDAHGVDLVLVGVEELGIQDFLDGKYFENSESKIIFLKVFLSKLQIQK